MSRRFTRDTFVLGDCVQPTAATFLDLTLRPSIEILAPTRRFVLAAFEAQVGGVRETGRIALAAHELLENAARYSTDGEIRFRLEIEPTNGSQHVTLATWNLAAPTHLDDLQRYVAELRTTEPSAYLQAQLRRFAASGVGAGLGLARIRADADMLLACDVEQFRAHVRATGVF